MTLFGVVMLLGALGSAGNPGDWVKLYRALKKLTKGESK